jgi:hypothetical protein
LPTRTLAAQLGVIALVMVAWCALVYAQHGHLEVSAVGRYNRLGNLIALGYATDDACTRRSCTAFQQRGVYWAKASADSAPDKGPYWAVVQLAREFRGVRTDDEAVFDSLSRVIAPAREALVVPLASLRRRLGFVLQVRLEYDQVNPDGRILGSGLYRALSKASWSFSGRLANVAVAWTAVYLAFMLAVRRHLAPEGWVRLTLWVLVLYDASVSVIGAYGDWTRLVAPALVPLNVLTLLLILDLVRGTTARLRASQT